MKQAKIDELFSFNNPRTWGRPGPNGSFIDASIYQTYDGGSGMAPPGVTPVPGGTLKISKNPEPNYVEPITVMVTNPNNAQQQI